MNLIDEIKQDISKLVQKKQVVLVKRGNDAIQQSLQLAHLLGKRKLLICDQGGWLTYPTYGKDMGFEIVVMKTDHGVLSPQELQKHLDEKSVLLINSLPGYISPQDMGILEQNCKRKNCFLINDAAGSIGTVHAQIGNIILASFGSDKPLKIGFGKAGFIACDDDTFLDHFIPFSFSEKELQEIKNAVKGLQDRLRFLQQKRIPVIKELQEKNKKILFPTRYGINVIILFENEKEKKEIITYCEKNHLEYTLCPREIRVLDNAVSVEIKRL
ncbi:DegT/DnrJ/EryC1/StrS family aminotransferase [Candidatus Woesearchaeota archaeon]|nr:DegT/DnrJ/EryC1/StrS family aminotransferase [Candidatus Woesearchaeota archaeon]